MRLQNQTPFCPPEDCIDQVDQAKFVSKFDLLKGYWQVPLSEWASKITVFVTPNCNKVIPFGLRNTPVTFQRLMIDVLEDLEGCTVNLDVFSDTWSDNFAHIHTLFGRLVEVGRTVNLAKCEFARTSVMYLSCVFEQGTVCPIEEKIRAIEYYPAPTTWVLWVITGVRVLE